MRRRAAVGGGGCGGERWSRWGHEAPVFAVGATRVDPSPEDVDLIRFERFFFRRRRHDVVGVGRLDAVDEGAGVRFAWQERGVAGIAAGLSALGCVEAEPAFARGGVRPVAGEAMAAEDRLDVAREIRRGQIGGARRGGQRDCGPGERQRARPGCGGDQTTTGLPERK